MPLRVWVGPVYSRFDRDFSFTLREHLDKAMTVKPENWRFMPKVKKRQWDGTIHFFNRTSASFYTGLLPWVRALLRAEGYLLEIHESSQELPPHTIELKPNYTLRDYQRPVVEEAIPRRRGIVHAAVNAGKTLIAAEIFRRLRLRTLYLVPTKELWRQAYLDFKTYVPQAELGQIREGVFAPGLITIAMVQSLLKRLSIPGKTPTRVWLRNIECLIADEVHKMGATRWSQIFKQAKGASYRYGLSATPVTETASRDLLLRGLTGDIFSGRITTPELVKRGFSTPTTVFFVEYPYPPIDYSILSNTDPWGYPAPDGDLDPDEIGWRAIHLCGIKLYRSRALAINKIVRRELAEQRRVAIFVDTVRHGNFISGLLDNAIMQQTMYGRARDEQRIWKLDRFKSGEQPVLITTLLREGVNLPEMDSLIIAGGGKTPTGIAQRAGRVVRTRKGKLEARIYDFLDAQHPVTLAHSERRYWTYKKEGYPIGLLDLTKKEPEAKK